MSRAIDPVPIRTLSRYELLEEIGRGNMGVVYKARDPAVDRVVAIKIFRLGFSLDENNREVYLKRFRREARIAGGLNHPHIAAIHDFGFGEEPFLVMEYFPGVSLSRVLEKGFLPLEEVEVVARQLGEALAYAHDRGVIHRDVKPANVLYRAGAIKLVDFGVARLETSELSSSGEFLGTPTYMSPEIFSGGPVDARSDLFSLGVVLYQLLTGRRPFEGPTVSRTIYRVLHEEPEPPSRIRPEIPPGWDGICGRLLAKDPEERTRNARSFLAELDRLLLPEAQPAAPPVARWRLSALVVVLILLLGTGFSLWYSGREPVVPSEPADAAAPAVPPPPPQLMLPLTFVARHEHRLGHCTGDLFLLEDGIRFQTTRHGDWTWGAEDIERLDAPAEDEILLRARSWERGRRTELETFRFTFLRPSLPVERFRGYRELLQPKSGPSR